MYYEDRFYMAWFLVGTFILNGLILILLALGTALQIDTDTHWRIGGGITLIFLGMWGSFLMVKRRKW